MIGQFFFDEFKEKKKKRKKIYILIKLRFCEIFPWETILKWLSRLGLQNTPTDSSNKCPVYVTKQFDGEASVMQELRGMRSILSLPSFPSPLWPGVVSSDRVLSVSQIELFEI